MAMFLLKTEPGEYSFADLVREKRCVWSGVSNPGALIALRSMRKGDEIFIYHTGNEKAIVGLAKAASNPYEDPERPGTTDEGLPKFAVVDLMPGKPTKTPVTLAAIKADTRFAAFGLVKQSRLSAMPVPEALAKVLREWMGL
ncbi:MAG: EVE domain-containing protein [Phycisphaerales bacterium]|nr:MAG: EVE domain-containing protein [Phycisphaerales bacterium]